MKTIGQKSIREIVDEMFSMKAFFEKMNSDVDNQRYRASLFLKDLRSYAFECASCYRGSSHDKAFFELYNQTKRHLIELILEEVKQSYDVSKRPFNISRHSGIGHFIVVGVNHE